MKNPSIKERRFLKAYLEGKTLAECAKYAGSRAKDSHSLSEVGYRLLKKVGLSMPEMLDLCGLTDEVLAEKLREALEANRLYLASFRGKFLDERKEPDVPTRLKAVELIGRMKGLFVDRHEITGKEGGEIELVVTPAKRGEPKKIDLD